MLNLLYKFLQGYGYILWAHLAATGFEFIVYSRARGTDCADTPYVRHRVACAFPIHALIK